MGSGSGEGIRCVTDDADTDFLDRRVCFGFTEKKKKLHHLKFKIQISKLHNITVYHIHGVAKTEIYSHTFLSTILLKKSLNS